MKRFGLTISLLAGVLCFAQATNTITITLSADAVAAYSHSFLVEYSAIQSRAAKLARPLTEDNTPSTVEGMLKADIATIIADKAQRYSPADLPAKQVGESDGDLRNRYQALLRSSITVK